MFKYILTFITIIVIAGCIFNGEDKKGSLTFTIKWPDNAKVTRVIPDNCTKIFISLMKYQETGHKIMEKEIEKTGTVSNLKIEDIETGEWSVSVILKDINGTAILNTYKMVDICEGENILEIIFGIPQVPYYLYPAPDSEVTTTANIVLRWQSVGADFPTTAAIYSELQKVNYDVYFGESVNLTDNDILNKDSTISSTMAGVYIEYYNLPTLEAGKTYFWKVKAKNIEGSSESYVSSFKIKSNVPPAIPITPVGVITTGAITQFKWSVAADIEKDNQYQIVVDKYPLSTGTAETKVFPTGGYLSQTEYNLSTTEQSWFTNGYYYYWHVVIIDSNGATVGPTEFFEIMVP